jgi:hypothetical protein
MGRPNPHESSPTQAPAEVKARIEPPAGQFDPNWATPR